MAKKLNQKQVFILAIITIILGGITIFILLNYALQVYQEGLQGIAKIAAVFILEVYMLSRFYKWLLS